MLKTKELEGLLFAKEVSLWLLLFMSVNLLHLEIKCTALSCSIFWLKIWPFIHVFWRKDAVAWQQHSRDSDWEEWHISCLFITWQLYNCLSLHPQGWTVRPGQQNQHVQLKFLNKEISPLLWPILEACTSMQGKCLINMLTICIAWNTVTYSLHI